MLSISFRKKNIYTKNGNWWKWSSWRAYISSSEIDEIHEILITERDKRSILSLKYNKDVNAVSVIDHCLGVSAIGLGITGVGLLSTIVAAQALIGMEALTIVFRLQWVVGSRAIKKMSLKLEKHNKIAMLAVSTLHV